MQFLCSTRASAKPSLSDRCWFDQNKVNLTFLGMASRQLFS